jgi:hypothetical protein
MTNVAPTYWQRTLKQFLGKPVRLSWDEHHAGPTS